MELEDILKIAFPSGAISGLVVAALLRYFMDTQVKKVVAKYEATLRDRTEVLKTDLSIHAHETTIGLTRLEELRAKAIQEIYTLIISWQELFLEITQPNLPQRANDERQLLQLVNWSQNLVKESQRLSIKVRDSALFFDEQSYQVIARHGKLMTDLSIDFYDATFGNWDKSKEPDYPALFKSFDTQRVVLREKAKGEYDKAQKTLVIEFRKLMKAEKARNSADVQK